MKKSENKIQFKSNQPSYYQNGKDFFIALFIVALAILPLMVSANVTAAFTATEISSDGASVNQSSVNESKADEVNSTVSTSKTITHQSFTEQTVKPISAANRGYISQVFVGLVMVLALIFLIATIVKRFGGAAILNNQHMKILSTLSLGQKEKVLIIEAGDQQLLLGVTSQQITRLHHFEQPIVDLKTKQAASDFTKKIQQFLSQQPIAQDDSSEKTAETHNKQGKDLPSEGKGNV